MTDSENGMRVECVRCPVCPLEERCIMLTYERWFHLKGERCRMDRSDYWQEMLMLDGEVMSNKAAYARKMDALGGGLGVTASYGWYQALDTESYGLGQDEGTRGLC
jgi:hypothetical protein